MSLNELIPNVQKGGSPTLLNADLANQLIDKVNALTNIKITRSSFDAVVIGSDGIIITLRETPEQDDSTVGGDTLNGTQSVPMFVCVNGTATIKNILFLP